MTHLRQSIELLQWQRSRNPVASFPPTRQFGIILNFADNLESGCSEMVATISSRINRGRFATSTRMGFIACPVSQRPPRRIFTFSNWFPCPHGRDVSHRVQYSLLRRFNLARMNIERGPIEHAKFSCDATAINSQLGQSLKSVSQSCGRLDGSSSAMTSKSGDTWRTRSAISASSATSPTIFDAGLIREG